MSENPSQRPATQCIHAGQSHEPITGAVMQPVFQTSTYAQPWPAKHTGYEYARTQNPTREALERAVAAQFDAGEVAHWQGQRCVSHDRLPLVGAVQATPDASLWMSAAMGARGLTLAALCAELLAARIHTEPLPLPTRLARLLDAQRLERRTQCAP